MEGGREAPHGRQARARPAERGTAADSLSNLLAGPTRQSIRRVAVVLACLSAWCILSAIPLPGLAPTAVGRQLSAYPLRAISVARIGVTPVIGSMFLLYLCGIVSVRMRQALGRVRDLRYQLWLVTLVLVFAVLGARAVLEELRTNGQLGSGPTDYYVAWVALVAGSALTLGLGWLVATYGFQVTPVRGWTFFYAADVVSRWASSTRSAWDQINPRTLTDGWPLAEEAGIIVISLALLAALLRARRRVPLRVGAEPGLVRDRIRSEALILPLLMGGGIYPAMMAAAGVVAINWAIQLVHGPAIVDPAAAGLLFLVGLGSVAFLQRATFNPEDVASNLREHSARIPGIRPGAATAAYIHRRVTLLTVIAAPWFALLLAAPQLAELLLPPEARIGLDGITIVLVGTIVIGILDTLGETAAE